MSRSTPFFGPHIARWIFSSVVILALPGGDRAKGSEEPPDPDPGRFLDSIEAFEEADRDEPPEPGQILFLGSSSIRRWNLDAFFPGLDTLNRGFGGSQLSDVIHFADRVVSPYHPRVIVAYAGDNDLNAGKSPGRVARDFQTLCDRISDHAPESRILFLAIKPSIARRLLWDEIQRANDLIHQACDASDRLEFIDVASPMLDPEGEMRPSLYVDDGLHLSDEGYELWARTLAPALERSEDTQGSP